MIIYGEDLAPTGYTATELTDGGKASDRRPPIADALLSAAQKRITIDAPKIIPKNRNAANPRSRVLLLRLNSQGYWRSKSHRHQLPTAKSLGP